MASGSYARKRPLPQQVTEKTHAVVPLRARAPRRMRSLDEDSNSATETLTFSREVPTTPTNRTNPTTQTTLKRRMSQRPETGVRKVSDATINLTARNTSTQPVELTGSTRTHVAVEDRTSSEAKKSTTRRAPATKNTLATLKTGTDVIEFVSPTKKSF